MSKVNSMFKDYAVFEYDSKSGTAGEIIKSKLTKEQARELYNTLGANHGWSRIETYNNIKNN